MTALAALALGAVSTHAAIITVTDTSLFNPPTSVIDFSEFGGIFRSADDGPFQVGVPVSRDITWSGPNSNTRQFGTAFAGSYVLGANGTWTAGRGGFVGLNQDIGTPSASIRFDFNDGPVASVGGFVNYRPGQSGAPTLTVLGAGDVLLGTFDLASAAPISTPAMVDEGAFRGFAGSADIIHAFVLSGSYIVIDDLTFAYAIPEPGTFVLLGSVLGLAGLGRTLRRRKLAAADEGADAA